MSSHKVPPKGFYWDSNVIPASFFYRKAFKTFFYPKFLWNYVINERSYEKILHPAQKNKKQGLILWYIYKAFLKIVWFWPRVTDEMGWIKGDVGVFAHDPSDFKNLTEHSKLLLQLVEDHAQDKSTAILDLGCNCGRHLAPLAKKGYTNLFGVDVSARAIELMPEWFPETKGNVDAQYDFAQRYLNKCQDKQFDVMFSHGATVELIHPSFPLVKEMCRATQSYIILLFHENLHRHPRLWEYEFRKNGFLLTRLLRPVQQDLKVKKQNSNGHNLSLMIFRRIPSGLA